VKFEEKQQKRLKAKPQSGIFEALMRLFGVNAIQLIN
jgi:hypothetical protein